MQTWRNAFAMLSPVFGSSGVPNRCGSTTV
jgi:hypothetical protein